MSDRLTMYNDALLMAGERSLGSLTEVAESRRLLDQVWNSGGVKKCLEEGQWKFAMRTVQLDFDPALTPSFGYRRAFDKPTDWIVTSSLASDAYFSSPLLGYFDEAQYWYADVDKIYVRYVSDDVGYGLNINKWPGSFQEFVSAHFASRVTWKLTGSKEKLATVNDNRKELKKIALNKDAMAEPTRFPPPGSWVKSRLRTGGARDLGNIAGDLY